MDPLALLTRSAKRPKTHNRNTPSHLPSSGPSRNPQLYHNSDDPAAASQNSLKRKRGDATGEETAQREYGDVDFFGQKPSFSSGAEDQGGHDDLISDSTDEEGVRERMSLEDRRRVFKEHKLKFSVLSRPQEPSSHEKKKKKKKNAEVNTEKKASKHADAVYPEPVTRFHDLHSRYKISNTLARNVREQGFKLPTEVQIGSLPLLLGGTAELVADDEAILSEPSLENNSLNLLTIAPTGSGKTLAFLIPLINAIGKERSGAKAGPQAVILAPTKELISQIVNEARKLAVDMDINIQGARKGIDLGLTETSDTSKIPDIVVATPIGLLHILEVEDDDTEEDATKKAVKEVRKLSSARYLVLDEADVLLDALFKTQTLSVWDALDSPILTVSLWSATISSSVETDIRASITKRHDSAARAIPLVRLVVGLKDSAVPNIAHRLTYCATEPGKLMALRELISPKSSASSGAERPLRAPFLVFTQTIPRATALHSELKFDIPTSAGGSSRIAVLHSELPDRVRDKILTNFRKGEIWVLITTDLLSRGVDFKGVNGVVNYDIPTSAASYVHRVGRTGRAGREGGVAVTLFTKEDIKWVKIIANIAAAADKNKAGGGVEQWLLDALPDVSKQDRKKLKTKGVQGRRKDEKTSRITSKSGYVRREENKRRDRAKASGRP